MYREYFPTLVDDFDKMGLLNKSDFFEVTDSADSIASYSDLQELVGGCTYELDHAALPQDIEPLTPLARAICQIPKQVTFDSTGWIGCSNAEVKLLRNISHREAEDVECRGPLLVTDKERVVAIVKQHGEQTAYAIEDDPQSGLVRGTFFAPSNLTGEVDPRLQAPRSQTVYRVEYNDLPAIVPIRYSLFATPVRPRRSLLVDYPAERQVLLTSHTAITRRAAELACSAVHLSV